MLTWFHVARQLYPCSTLRPKVRQLVQILGCSVRHVNRRRVPSPVISSVRSAAVSSARLGHLAHPEGQFTSNPFALPRRAVIIRLAMGDGGRARPADAARMEHLRRDGPRIRPPSAIRARLLRKAALLRLDDVRRQRRALSLVEAELGIALVARVDLWSLRGLCGVMELPSGRRSLRAPRAARSDARPAPVPSGETVRPAADLRNAPRGEDRRDEESEKKPRGARHVALLEGKKNGATREWSPCCASVV